MYVPHFFPPLQTGIVIELNDPKSPILSAYSVGTIVFVQHTASAVDVVIGMAVLARLVLICILKDEAASSRRRQRRLEQLPLRQ